LSSSAASDTVIELLQMDTDAFHRLVIGVF
jgi:hypothetical protein